MPILIIIIVLTLVGFAVVLGIALGIGWLLTLFLPFTLFEGAVLSMLVMLFVGAVIANIVRSIVSFMSSYDYDEFEDEVERNEIPATRFFKADAERTWVAWFRYQLANEIYAEFQAVPNRIAPTMEDKQVQELAIRIADIALEIIKAKTERARRLNITKSRLKQQMANMGQRPYDDDILTIAVGAINMTLDYHYEDFIEVIHNRWWDKLVD